MKVKVNKVTEKDNIKRVIHPLDRCVTAANAEMARTNDKDEPCYEDK